MKKLMIIALAFLLSLGLLGCEKNPKVTYKDGENVLSAVEVKKGEKAVEVKDPEKEGYDFTGWYLDGALYDFNNPVNKDITLTAGWEEEKFVNFYVNDVLYATVKVIRGKVKVPEAPKAEEGYTFGGWENEGQEVDFDENVEGGFNVHARFKTFKRIQSMEYEKEVYYIGVGKTETPKLKIAPVDWKEDLMFASSDESVATVNKDGEVTGIKDGTAAISVVSESGMSAVTSVVVGTLPTAISTSSTIKLDHGKSTGISVKFTPENTTIRNLTYSSSDKSIVSVDSEGNIKAVGYGTATITVKTVNGLSKKITVYANGTDYSYEMYFNDKPVGKTNTIYFSDIGNPTYYFVFNRIFYSNGECPHTFVDYSRVEVKGTHYICMYTPYDSDATTLYLTKSASLEKMPRPSVEKIHFEYTDENGKVIKSPEYTFNIEVQLKEKNGDTSLASYDAAAHKFHLNSAPGKDVDFVISIPVKDAEVWWTKSVFSLVKKDVTDPHDSSKPIYYNYYFRVIQDIDAGTITFDTPGGQSLYISAIY